MKTIYLNIHNFLTVQINQPSRREYIKDIDQPLSYFETQVIENPDIILNIGDFEPHNDSCSVVDHKCYIKSDYIYSSDHIGKVPFKVEIKGLESSPTTINLHIKTRTLRQLILPSELIQKIFLMPIIDFKLLQRRVLPVHAAGVVGNRGAMVLLGRGGTFKTSVAMDLIRKKGYKFLGDDHILISDSKVYCYPSHHKFFDFRMSKLKTESCGLFDKLRYLLYQARKQKSCDFIVDSAPLFKTLCMVKHTGKQIKTRKLNKTDLAQKTTQSRILENLEILPAMGISGGKLYEYFIMYSFIFPQSKVASYWKGYKDLLDEYFTDEDFQEICLPPKYTTEIYSQVISLME